MKSGQRRLLVVVACGLAMASARTPAHATPPPAPVVAPAVDWDAYHLGRAVDSWLRGDTREAAAFLALVDISPASTFPEADRAAFLLAAASLQLNDRAGFDRVANLAGNDTGSAYRRWIRYLQIALAGEATGARNGLAPAAPAGFPAAGIMGAAFLLEYGRAREALALLDATEPAGEVVSIHRYLRARACEALGEDPSRTWKTLAESRASNAHEADLVGYTVLRVATRTMEDGGDARPVLERMPAASRHAPRALHLRALLTAAAGDTAAAHAMLRRVLADHPAYEARREVLIALGGMMMDAGHWHAALRYFESAADQWDDESGALSALSDTTSIAAAWATWNAPANWRDEIRLSADALLRDVFRYARASLDLRHEPSLEPDEGLARGLWPAAVASAPEPGDSTAFLLHHAPSRDERERVRALERREADARNALADARRVVHERQRTLEQLDRYLARGAERAVAGGDTLARAGRELEAVIARLDTTLAELTRVRDIALDHVAARTCDMIVELERELLFIRAVRHFHVDGPNAARPERLPPGTPSPAELLAREEALATGAVAFLDFFAGHYADVIRRSFDEAWRPRLAEGSRRLRGEIGAEVARARTIGAGIDSARAGLARDPALAAAIERRDRMASALDSARVATAGARRDVALAVAARARTELAAQREAIDYSLADAVYEVAVQMATDSTVTDGAATIVPARDRAITQLEFFLDRHPESAARAEVRYRLADLHLMRARDDFRERMAAFSASATAGNPAPVPLVESAPAVELYLAILREDPGFAHTDAVLFNLGMILADEGDPGAMQHLARLVEEYPGSPDAQGAWLRMGNHHFERESFPDAVRMFEHAAAGPDPSFAAMALYKLGWSYFEEDRFEDAAGAFAGLVDHYGRHPGITRTMDLRDEAEEYLVHSLARSGGAPAFERHFARTGARDYESRVLSSLAGLLRGASLFGEAAECERLWLSRYPDDAGALEVTERLVDTYRRWNRPELARATKRAEADRFLPGSAWQRAQHDPALRRSAEDFARGAYREAAAYGHAQARAKGDAGDWHDVRTRYEAYLAHWPDAGDAPRMHYLASEAAAKTADYPAALRHLSASITGDSLALVQEASWQRVAVADAWYRQARAAVTPAPQPGADSLAALVIGIGDQFLARFPRDPRAADVAWRQGNLAFAHAWYDDSAARLEQFGERHPSDPRALAAVTRGADARYRLRQYDRAGAAYERALVLARSAGRDSVVTAMEKVIPTCHYQHAEAVANADSARGDAAAAPLFARVARDWPRFEHADRALYRAGLGFAARGDRDEAVAAWEEVLRVHPRSEYARDSAVQVAQLLEASGNADRAARAFDRFATLFPQDADATAALLKSADLLEAAGQVADAERVRDRFIAGYPAEVASVMSIRAKRAGKELDAVAAGHGSVTALLSKSSKSELKAYLALAGRHPDLASAPLLARSDYLAAEAARNEFGAVALTQPLPASIEKKRARLEKLLAAYERAAGHGVTEYTRASTHRIGQSLVDFGDALMASERPAGLAGDDLLAYEDVITEQAWGFYDRGEDVWSELLRQSLHDENDPGGWTARTRDLLWPRLAQRFQFHPEVRYPLLAGTPPAAREETN